MVTRYIVLCNLVKDYLSRKRKAAIMDGLGMEDPLVIRSVGALSLPATTLQVALASRIDNEPVNLGSGATMTFLYLDSAPHSSLNESSVVLRLDLGQTRVLLMGDAEAGGRASPQSAADSDSIEGILLTCCRSALEANILVVGHHGSKTSSRTSFLDAVGTDTFIVSSGPTQYGSVVLPDQEVVTELQSRGNVYRTDLNDDSCRTNSAKISPDNDGRPGGCSNIRITVSSNGSYSASYWLH